MLYSFFFFFKKIFFYKNKNKKLSKNLFYFLNHLALLNKILLFFTILTILNLYVSPLTLLETEKKNHCEYPLVFISFCKIKS
jgi:hypothetical protein